MAEKSSQWNYENATETLAEILVKQGNKKRALNIYKALMLKYPEKKTLFAEIIKNIK